MRSSCFQQKTNYLIYFITPFLLAAATYASTSHATTISVNPSTQLIKPFDLAYRGYNNSPRRYDNRYKGGYNYGRVTPAPVVTPHAGAPYYRHGHYCSTRCVPSASTGRTYCYKYCT